MFCFHSSKHLSLLCLLTTWVDLASTFPDLPQAILKPSTADGHNELYIPDIDHPIPGKIPFKINEEKHYYLKYTNGSDDGSIRRSSCPAVNALANRGYINRSGRNITWEDLSQAARDVWNFGDDNVRSSWSFQPTVQ